MSLLLHCLLAAGTLLGQISENINALTLDTVQSPEEQAAYTLVSSRGYESSCDMRELYLRVPVDAEEEARLAALLGPDGAWSDINYLSTDRSGWEPIQHGLRVCRLAILYRKSGRSEVLDMLHRALSWWFTTRPECTNWWYNEIGLPRAFGPAFLLLWDEFTPAEKEGAIAVLGRAGLRMTGQNKVWQAGSVLIRGLLQDDEALVRAARDSIASEIRLGTGEGLQDDWSFHQHGPQLQWGNYGLSFAVSLSWWVRALHGTELAIPEEQVELLRNYVREGLSRLVWKDRFDPNACGRQVFLNTQQGKAVCIAAVARNLGLSEKELTRAQRGGRYFPRSDFGIFRTRRWYASVRMNSCRTVGFEAINGENMKGYFTGDGALLLRRDGREYDNIFALWDWLHIPGTTSYDDGRPLWGMRGRARFRPQNRSGKVFGQTHKGLMVTAMELDRDSLHARKAWFFWKGGIVCLGAGIQKSDSARVYTTVEQCHLRGNVEQNAAWVRHAGVTYIPLDGQPYTVLEEERSGDWSDLGPGHGAVSGRVFEMYTSHGAAPSGASYAYAVVPDARSGRAAQRRLRRVKLVENGADRQVLRLGRNTVTVNWEREEICFSR
ncbi:MAG: sugar lyase [Bacteroidales bacterium]|nr:sugar lyase [Bacteroidales bacterium]